jgi:hypothetical protein
MSGARVGWLGSIAFGTALWLACGGEPATPAELCAALLESKLPGADVTATMEQAADQLTLAYALPVEDEPPAVGELVCHTRHSALGGLRLESAVLDGRALSETELVVRNSNLLLDELYAIGRGD